MTREYTEITVVGGDSTGLVSEITTLLFERGCNIEDIDQAVRDGLFRMTMDVDADPVDDRADLRAALRDLGRELGVDVQVRFPSDRDARRVAVLVTKESHCLETLLAAEADGELAPGDDAEAEIPVVIGNRGDLRAVAERYDTPFYDVGDGSGAPDEGRLLDLLAEYDVDLIALARYMRILSPEVVFRYEDRILNVHPSLLPAFPGAQAYRQATEAGVRVAGVTAHYVTTDLDQGPIITQRAFDVPPGTAVEEMERTGQPLEAEALLEAVRLHLDDAVYVHHGRTEPREDLADDHQFGLPDVVDDTNPDRPLDGLGGVLGKD